jgi:hypothetical protein
VLLAAIAAVAFGPQGKDDQSRQAVRAGAANAGDVLGHAAQPQPHLAQRGKSQSGQSAKSAVQERDPFDYGSLPAIKADANPQVQAVVAAIRQGNHPERVSAMMRPRLFDAKAQQADPAAYFEVVEPGRVFQTAQPGPGVPRLAAAGNTFHQVAQGQAARLRVQAPAGAPVSFTAFDGGQFDNQLSSITVRADARGVAETRLLATSGTIEDLNVLAGSPLASGQVKFVVNVQMPDREPVTSE